MSLKSTVEKIKSLEAEKASLLAEVEGLKRSADARANALADEITALKEQVASLKILMEQEKPQHSDQEIREKNVAALQELAQKTLSASDLLGNQVFADSPFSKYYDGWLTSFKQVVSDFEISSPFKMDEQFINDRSQIFLNVESALGQIGSEESELGAVAKALAENNHLLVEADKEYAEKARELGLKRESEVAQLTNRVHELEHQVQIQDEENSKRKILKKKSEDKLPQARADLMTAKDQLEATERSFATQQDSLHEAYEKKKNEIGAKVDSLHGQLEKLEADGSIEARQTACRMLMSSVNALVQRVSMKP